MKKNSNRSATKAKGSTTKRRKFFVDNPNTSELKMLDRMKRKRGNAAASDTAADTHLSAGEVNLIGTRISTGSIQPTVNLSSIAGAPIDMQREETTWSTWQANECELLPLAVMDSRLEEEELQESLEMTAIAHTSTGLVDKEQQDMTEEKRGEIRLSASICTKDIEDRAIIGSKLGLESIDNEHLIDNTIAGGKLRDCSITGEKLVEGAVMSQHLHEQCIHDKHLSADAIRSEAIADFSVISSKIAPEAIQGDHIASLTVLSHHIADRTIRPYHLHEGAIEREALALSSVDGMRLAIDTICDVHIQDNAVTSRTIQSQAITCEKLADYAVASWHLQPQAIEPHHLQHEAVATDALQDGSITSDKLAYGAVSSMHLSEEAIQNEHIEDGAVDGTKLAADSVSGDHIRAGSIYERHLGFMPVRACSDRAPAMQFGTNSFAMMDGTTHTEVSIVFPQAYEHAAYSLVATTNVSGCYAVIVEQYKDGAVLQIMGRPEPQAIDQEENIEAPITNSSVRDSGSISWIAIG